MSKKNMGHSDLGGQKSRSAGEGPGQSEKRPAKVSIPDCKPAPTRVFRSDDDLIHFSRSDGLRIK